MRAPPSASAVGSSGGTSKCALPVVSRPTVLMAMAPCTRPLACNSASGAARSASTRRIRACGTPPLAAAAIALRGRWPYASPAGVWRFGKVAKDALIIGLRARQLAALAPGRQRCEQSGEQRGVQRTAVHVGLQRRAVDLVGPPVTGVRTWVEAERQIGPGRQAVRGHRFGAAVQPGIQDIHDVAAAGP